MPILHTTRFGPIEYDESSVILFPVGLPAFESERQFIALRDPANEPLLFLQSLTTASLAFLALAVQDITLDYRVELADEDTELLGGAGTESDFEVLAFITVAQGGEVSANLQAPVVIHRHHRRAVQSIQFNPSYAPRHMLGAAPQSPEETSPCL